MHCYGKRLVAADRVMGGTYLVIMVSDFFVLPKNNEKRGRSVSLPRRVSLSQD